MTTPADAAPPPSEPGSVRYFVLLYCPTPRRAALAALLAVGDEINAGLARALDHSVAHVRLQFWQREADLWRDGRAEHPYLRALHLAQPDANSYLDLAALVSAGAADLATQTLANERGGQLSAALFVACGSLLMARRLSAAEQAQLAALGLAVRPLERSPAAANADADTLTALIGALEGVTPALRPALAPLLVWGQLLRHRARAATGPIGALRDNWIAWRTARRALTTRIVTASSA